MENIQELEAQLEKSRKEYAEKGDEIVRLVEKLRDIRSATLDLNVITPEKYMAIKNIDQYNTAVWKRLRNWFDKNYNMRGLYSSGEMIDCGQRSLSLYFEQSRPYEDQLGILDFLPYMEYNHIGMMTEDCSRSGVLRLHNIKSGKPELRKTVYGRERVEKTFETLDEALRYCYNNLPASE